MAVLMRYDGPGRLMQFALHRCTTFLPVENVK